VKKKFKNVYQFKITLKGIKPPIWRRIRVPETYTFWDFHVAIQDAMGWLDMHLHDFDIFSPRAGRRLIIGIPDEDFEIDRKTLAGWKHKISDYFSMDNKKSEYVYDFGDDWCHSVNLEKILPREAGVNYPVCTAGKRSCPPEDCGGVWGYYDLLDIITNPDDERYEEMLEWLEEDFDPEYFDVTEITFSDPQKRWDMAFYHMDDLDEDEIIEGEEEITGGLRPYSREYMHQIWEKAKNNDLGDLGEEEKLYAKIMLEHEDEFFNEFEFADLTRDYEYDPETDSDPFLHVLIHSIVETQLEDKSPIEAYQFYNAMRKKGCSPHDAIHLIGAILAPMIFEVVRDQKPFDVDTYVYLLRKYKTRKPDRILDLLDKESRLSFFDS
jgi:hypothetical protein